jgi:cytoskeleton protein RodZ
MKDKAGKTETEEATGPVGGERLRIARCENDISVRDIAKKLNLDEPKVRALEKNDFDALGAPVFAKGHLRKYAELVGISTDDIMSDYFQMNRSVGARPLVGPKRTLPRDVSLGPWIGGIVLIAIFAGALYWWFTRELQPEVPTIEPAALAPFSSASDDADEGSDTGATNVQRAAAEYSIEIDAASEASSAVAEAKETVASSPGTISERINSPPSDLPRVEVELSYSGDCWTEVSDASGRRLFYDLGQSGRTITLSGDSPLRVILGDSANVGVTVEGNAYSIPASARTGRLARLTLGRR